MRNRLLIQRFSPRCERAGTVLIIEPDAAECALFDPAPDTDLLDCIADTVRLNHLSLSWILFTTADLEAYRAGRCLQQQLIAARLGVGALAQRARHNCAALSEARGMAPERLFDEEERVQIGSCFASVHHAADGDQIRSGYVFEDFAVFGCRAKQVRLLKDRPYVSCPLEKALEPSRVGATA